MAEDAASLVGKPAPDAEVVAVGPDAVGVKVGDRRVVFPWIGCGECSLCAAGDEHLCNSPRALGIHRDGGFATHTVVPHAQYLLDYGSLAEEQACTYACSGLTAYSALKKIGTLGPKDPLLIIGAGGVGLSGIRLARQMFGVAPIVVELDRGKWDIAREAGAGELIDPSAEGALKALLKATGGVAAAVDFVGAASSFNFGFGALRKAGKLICVGLFGGSTPIVPAMVSMKAVSVASTPAAAYASRKASSWPMPLWWVTCGRCSGAISAKACGTTSLSARAPRLPPTTSKRNGP